MDTESIFYKQGDVMDYTPASAKVAGEVVQVAERPGICAAAIAASVKGIVQVAGIIKVQKAQVAGNAGDPIWWDENGSPYGGTALSGAATILAKDGDFCLGALVTAAASTDTHAYVKLLDDQVSHPIWPNRVHETVSVDTTIDAEDSGKVIHVDTDAKTITLPATIAGLMLTLINEGADGAVALTISPNANDKIMGPNIAGVDNKDYINTKATAIRGDFVTLLGDGANGWFIIERKGTWAAEA